MYSLINNFIYINKILLEAIYNKRFLFKFPLLKLLKNIWKKYTVRLSSDELEYTKNTSWVLNCHRL